MRRSELDPADLAELAALERILAGDAVDASELELAALVESVRAAAPALDEDAVARLDARLAAPAAAARGPRRRSGRRVAGARRRNLLIGGAAAALAAGALALVIAVAGPGPTT